MSAPRGLSAEEAAAWARVAETVTAFHPRTSVAADPATIAEAQPAPPPASRTSRQPATLDRSESGAPRRAGADKQHLDSTWDRKLARGTLQPDLTLDLHGHSLEAAYTRLMDGLDQARAMGARTVLLVTGKARPVASADRAGARGAIRAKVLDWLAASRHHAAIAAIRNAHIRHGGAGALYIVLRKSS